MKVARLFQLQHYLGCHFCDVDFCDVDLADKHRNSTTKTSNFDLSLTPALRMYTLEVTPLDRRQSIAWDIQRLREQAARIGEAVATRKARTCFSFSFGYAATSNFLAATATSSTKFLAATNDLF